MRPGIGLQARIAVKEAFNPYHEWLGLESNLRQPNFYQLCGLADFESDPAKIRAAVDRAVVKVRGFRPGAEAPAWAQLLDELAQAKKQLTDPEQKAAYDLQLRPAPSDAPSGNQVSDDVESDSVVAAVSHDPNRYPPGMGPPVSPADRKTAASGSRTGKSAPKEKAKPAASSRKQVRSKGAAKPVPRKGVKPASKPVAARVTPGSPARQPVAVDSAAPPAKPSRRPAAQEALDSREPTPHPVNAHLAPPAAPRPSSWPMIVGVAAVIVLLTLGMLYLAMYAAG